jgi:hypothetical protein
MLLICPECDKKLKLSDEAPAKKIKCPGCGAIIPVPGSKSAAESEPKPAPRQAPQTRSKAATKSGDSSAGKSNTGLYIALGAGALLVVVLVLVVGGVGAWWFLLRDTSKPSTQVAGNSGPTDKGNNVEELKATLSNGRVEWSGNQGQMRVAVNYSFTGPITDSHLYGCYVIFPSRPQNLEEIYVTLGSSLRNKVSGEWRQGQAFFTDPAVRKDAYCEIVLLTAADGNPQTNGKELARLKNVVIPPLQGTPVGPTDSPITVQLSSGAIERTSAAGDVSVRVDYRFSRKPDAGKTYALAINYQEKSKPFSAAVTQMRADELSITGKFTDLKANLSPGADDLCELSMTEAPDAKGGTRVVGTQPLIRVAPFKGPKKWLVTLSNIRIERVDDNDVNVSCEYEFSRAPDPKRWYTIVILEAHLSSGVNYPVLQGKGDKWQMKGEISNKVGFNELGKNKAFKVWMFDGETILDGTRRASEITTVNVVAGNKKVRLRPPDANLDCPAAVFFDMLKGSLSPFTERTVMNSDLRRRSDEVVTRLTTLRDSL